MVGEVVCVDEMDRGLVRKTNGILGMGRVLGMGLGGGGSFGWSR